MGEFEMQYEQEIVVERRGADHALGLLLHLGLLIEGNCTDPAQKRDPTLPIGVSSHRGEETLEQDAL